MVPDRGSPRIVSFALRALMRNDLVVEAVAAALCTRGQPRWCSAPCRPRQLVALPEGTEPAYNLRGSLVAWQGGSLRRQPRGRGPRCDAASASWSAAGTSAA